jgi:hypothetical protein
MPFGGNEAKFLFRIDAVLPGPDAASPPTQQKSSAI